MVNAFGERVVRDLHLAGRQLISSHVPRHHQWIVDNGCNNSINNITNSLITTLNVGTCINISV